MNPQTEKTTMEIADEIENQLSYKPGRNDASNEEQVNGVNHNRNIIAQAITHERQKVERLEKELERERLRLAACGVAAMTSSKKWEPISSEYKSASLDDVFSLRDRYEDAQSKLDSTEKRLSEVNIVLEGYKVLAGLSDPDPMKVFKLVEKRLADAENAPIYEDFSKLQIEYDKLFDIAESLKKDVERLKKYEPKMPERLTVDAIYDTLHGSCRKEIESLKSKLEKYEGQDNVA